MKIGILTFHWAINYGAVLQCYALQSFLESKGNQVKVINYKPTQYDDNICNFFHNRKFFHLSAYVHERKKRLALDKFRDMYLHQTKRVYYLKKISPIVSGFDAIVSGSDQVANPSFLLSGEGHVTPTYFLGFPFEGIRFGYALSFGCVSYPEKARAIAANYIKDFNVVTVREKTGIEIVKSMGRNDATVAPDPTLLMPPKFYQNLASYVELRQSCSFVYSFFIRNIKERKKAVNEILKVKRVLWNNEDGSYSIESWLCKIRNAEFVVTDSFHCVVMCLKFHVHFVVITEHYGNIGMNDRLYTLLENCNLIERILHKSNINDILKVSAMDINWSEVDCLLSVYSDIGRRVLVKYFN